jgi:hypothetical protein
VGFWRLDLTSAVDRVFGEKRILDSQTRSRSGHRGVHTFQQHSVITWVSEARHNKSATLYWRLTLRVKYETRRTEMEPT